MVSIPLASTGANLAFPEIGQHFAGSSRATLSWALTGYSIVIAASTLLGGQLSDRLGSMRMFTLGLAIFAFCNVAVGLAPTAGVLIAARFFMGVGGALIVPSSLAVILANCPESRRTFTIGVWTAAFPIGSSVAPVGTSLLLDLLGWRSVFLATALVSSLALFLALRIGDGGLASRASETAASAKSLPDFFGIVVGTLAMGLLSLGIVEGPSWGWSSPSIVGSFAAAAFLLPLFVWRSRRHQRPLLDLSLFEISSFRVANVANVFISVIGTTTWLLWPLMMTGIWHYSQIGVGLAMTPTPALAATGSLLAARYAANHGHRLVLISGSVCLAAACVTFAILPTTSPNYWSGMFPGLVLTGLGMGMTFAPLNGAALVDIPRSAIGQANAAFTTGRSLSGGLGIAAVVAVLDSPAARPLDNFDQAFMFLSVVALAAIIVLLMAWDRRPVRQPENAMGRI